MMTRTASILFAGAATLLLLAGCSKKPEEEQPMANDTVALPEPEPEAPPPVAAEPEKPAPEPANAADAADHDLSQDIQMLDDADATGMTSHLPPPETGDATPAAQPPPEAARQ